MKNALKGLLIGGLTLMALVLFMQWTGYRMNGYAPIIEELLKFAGIILALWLTKSYWPGLWVSLGFGLMEFFATIGGSPVSHRLLPLAVHIITGLIYSLALFGCAKAIQDGDDDSSIGAVVMLILAPLVAMSVHALYNAHAQTIFNLFVK